jgi:imidazolonepropionase-like amidohydrolase
MIRLRQGFGGQVRLLIATAAFVATPALAQSVAITGGKLVIGDGSAPIEGGTVVIVNRRVTAAGKTVAIPPGIPRVDASGKWVTTGIVAGFTRLGLAGVDAVDPSNDTAAANSPFNAALDIASSVNPDIQPMAISRVAGVTRAIVSPDASNAIFGGMGAAIDTGADATPVSSAKLFQFVEFGESGARRAGGSRPALYTMFRNALTEAREAAGGVYRDNAMLKRADAQALVPVVNGTMRLAIHVESATDIRAVLGMKREFPALNIVLIGATEGWRVASEIAAAGIPVIASAMNDLPSSFEQIASTQSSVGRMKAAGVKVSIGMIDDDDTRQAQYAMQYAGNMVAQSRVPGASGLTWDQAFAAITSGPAEAMGIGGDIGSLRAGRRGDVVIWDGDPLELATAVERVWIDGVQQPLSSRQTRLRQRYAKPEEGALPKAYER